MTTPSNPPPGRLRVGFVPGVTLTRWRRVWEERFPGVSLEVVEVPVQDQRRVLDDGAVDMCFARLPVDQDGLHAIPLYDEVMVAWASKEHPVTVLDEVTLADLADEKVLESSDPLSIDTAAHSGAVVLLVPMSIARSASRRDMAYLPVVDAPPSTLALTWRRDDDNEWIDEFIGVVRGRTAHSSRTVRERESGQGAKAQAGADKPRRPAPRGGAERRPGRPRGGRPRRR